MAQLLVRNIKDMVLRKLKEQAGRHGVSMEEEHRRILREALLGASKNKPSFREFLLSMPNVGEDKDFERGPQIDRSSYESVPARHKRPERASHGKSL